MLKVGIYGASGYTGQELIKILLRHPDVKIVALTSRKSKGFPVSDIFPVFEGLTELRFIDASAQEVAELSDAVFLALPHGEAMTVAHTFLDAGKKVIDLSADFRLRNVEVFEAWYDRHTAPRLINKAVYGLPELYRDAIKNAELIANPGCYPTSAILGLAPLLRNRAVDPASIIIDSKSGVSGAGREPQIGSLFCEVEEGFKAYKIGQHRHSPEIEQELSALAGCDVKVSFTPHLLPVNRGILSTIYATLTMKEVSTGELIDLYRKFYEKEKFVRVYKSGAFPNISSVRGSNYCDIGISVEKRTGRIIIISVIDNLVKGAAGQAVQCLNIMHGFREDAGLEMISLFP